LHQPKTQAAAGVISNMVICTLFTPESARHKQRQG
jgi:ribosomal protein L36